MGRQFKVLAIGVAFTVVAMGFAYAVPRIIHTTAQRSQDEVLLLTDPSPSATTSPSPDDSDDPCGGGPLASPAASDEVAPSAEPSLAPSAEPCRSEDPRADGRGLGDDAGADAGRGGSASSTHGHVVRIAAHCPVRGRAHGELVRSIAGDRDATAPEAEAACATTVAADDDQAGRGHGRTKPKRAKPASPPGREGNAPKPDKPSQPPVAVAPETDGPGHAAVPEDVPAAPGDSGSSPGHVPGNPKANGTSK